MSFSISYTYKIKDNYTKPLLKIIKSTDRLRRSTGKLDIKIKGLQDNTASLSRVINNTIISNSELKNSFDSIDTKINRLTHDTNTYIRSLQRIPGTIKQPKMNTVQGGMGHIPSGRGSRGRVADSHSRGRNDPGVFTGIMASMIAGGVVSSFVDFETSMNKLQSLSRTSDPQLKILEKRIRLLGKTTQFTATDVAESMSMLFQSDMDFKTALQSVSPILDLSAASGLSMAESADIATSAMAGMGLKTKNLTHLNDVLALSQVRGKANIQETGQALKTIAPIAHMAGIGLEEIVSAIAIVSKTVRGSKAGTFGMNALLKIMSPGTQKAAQILHDLHIKMSKFTQKGEIKDFTGFIQALSKTKITAPQLKEVFGSRGMRFIAPLLEQVRKSPESIQKLTKELIKANGVAQKMAKIRLKGLPGAIKMFVSAMSELNIVLFKSGLADFIEGILTNLTWLARNLSKTNPSLMKFIGIFAGLTTIAVPVLVVIGLVSAGITSLMTGFSLTVIGILGLSAALTTLALKNPKIKESFVNLAQSFSPITKFFRELDRLVGSSSAQGGLFDLAINAASKLINGMATDIKFLLGPLQLLADVLETINDFGLMDTLRMTGDMFTGGIFDFTSGVKLKDNSTDFFNKNQTTIDGDITIKVDGAGEVTHSSMTHATPGNLGFSMAQ